MNIVDKLALSISSSRSRYFLIFLLIAVVSLISFAISPDFKNSILCPVVGTSSELASSIVECPVSDGSSRLSALLDLLELILIVTAITYLFISSNKNEDSRYYDYPGFYLRKYKNETQRFLALKKLDTNDIVKAGTIGKPELFLDNLKEEELDLKLEKLIREKIQSINSKAATDNLTESQINWSELHSIDGHSVLFSNSVAELIPPSINETPLEKIKFVLSNDSYELPWFIAESGLELLAQKFLVSQKADYNGLTLALNDYRYKDSELTLNFSQSCYYNYLLTNMLPEMEVIPKVTIRDLIEIGAGGRLNTLPSSFAENHPGMSCLIMTADGKLIIPKRSANVTVFKDQLSPSISGAVTNITSWDREKREHSPLQWFKNELCEELKSVIDPDIISEKALLKEVKFLGMTREIKRLGKPELFFFLKIEQDSSSLKNAVTIESWEKKFKGGNTYSQLEPVDENENDGFLLLSPEDMFDSLTSTTEINSKKTWLTSLKDGLKNPIASMGKVLSKPPQGGYFISIKTETGEPLLLSESLLCNLILFRHWQKKLG